MSLKVVIKAQKCIVCEKKVFFIAVNMVYYKIFIFLFVSSTCTGKVSSNQCYLINYVVANKTDNWEMDHVNKENVAPPKLPSIPCLD